MFFFTAKYYILLLKYKSIEIFDFNNKTTVTVNFPTEVLNHLEIKDLDNFKKVFFEYLEKMQIKTGKAIILASDEVLFQGESDPAVFVSMMPFENDQVVVRGANIAGKKMTLALNKSYFQVVADVLTQSNLKVVSTLPALIFVSDYSKAIKKYKVYDFLNFLPKSKSFLARIFGF